MRQFLNYFIFRYLLPLFIIFLCYYQIDPLKNFRNHNEYYQNTFVQINRENICIQLFKKKKNNEQVNAFIMGNSCSHAFKTESWIPYLEGNNTAFHLDSYRENLEGILLKLKYLSRNKNRIDHLLLVLDESVLSERFPGYLYCFPKEIKNNDTFLKEHLKALTSIEFNIAYFSYLLNQKPNKYTQKLQFWGTNLPVSQNETGDIYYKEDEILHSDLTLLKDNLWIKSAAHRINIIGNYKYEGLTTKNINFLYQIKEIIDAKKTKIKIVVNPLYKQQLTTKNFLEALQRIFGSDNVYDFSRKTEYINDYSLYRDGVHYKPTLANQLLKIIYQNSKNK